MPHRDPFTSPRCADHPHACMRQCAQHCAPCAVMTAFQVEVGVDIRPLRISRYPCSNSACCVALRRMAACSHDGGILPRFSPCVFSARTPASIGWRRGRASRGFGEEQRPGDVCVRPAARTAVGRGEVLDALRLRGRCARRIRFIAASPEETAARPVGARGVAPGSGAP